MTYIIKKKELPDTVKIGLGTRYFRSPEIAHLHLQQLIKWKPNEFKNYDVYFIHNHLNSLPDSK